ncbi:sulfur carrier protein ThiS [Haliea sp. E17]|uniref:sulfur carrier protein ThiS n=1 Tax=Haliea sp. E17 TaxID=3401576 RepID=UPI003AAFABCE
MKILVNGEWRLTGSETLEDLVRELDFSEGEVATAVDGVFVSRGGREHTLIHEGTVVEIVSPMQGG